MARFKTFRKKRKYKHSNKHSNNNTKRTSKRTYKRTYKKRRTMKGGFRFSGENLLKEAVGNGLLKEGAVLARKAASREYDRYKTDAISATSATFVDEAQKRAIAVLGNSQNQKEAIDVLKYVGNFVKEKSVKLLLILQKEAAEADLRAKRAEADEISATQDERIHNETIKKTENELAQVKEEAANTKQKDEAEAEAIKKQEEAVKKELADISKDTEILLERRLEQAKAKQAEAKMIKDKATKEKLEALNTAKELRQKATEEEQKIQVAERIPPGTQIDLNIQQAKPIVPRISLPPITREHV